MSIRAEIFYDEIDRSYGVMISNNDGIMKDSGFRVEPLTIWQMKWYLEYLHHVPVGNIAIPIEIVDQYFHPDNHKKIRERYLD